ncbi:hypothetical protein [Paraprevotella clara]
MQIKEIIPKLWYWKKAAWTRPQWWCYDCMKPYLKVSSQKLAID